MHPICDVLGRSRESVTSPVVASWTIPQPAYRLLLEYLCCETAFCNRVVPVFLPYGFVTLRAVSEPPGDGAEQKKSR